MPEAVPSVDAALPYWPRAALSGPGPAGPYTFDLRKPAGGASAATERVPCEIRDAWNAPDVGLEKSGFECFRRPSAVRDWFDAEDVIGTYYAECRALARELTGAEQTFTFDHLIREPGKQTAGGGIGARGGVTGPQQGGGYVNAVHMDYTEGTEWSEYLALHDVREPRNAKRVVALNFWRPIVDVVENHALALCDARTVRADDLVEMFLLGYGPESYSWHGIGIPIYYVAASPAHRWYYYPRMTRDDVLVIKSYDSEGVIGRASPHTSFVDPGADAAEPPRRSVELRVLCYVGASSPESEAR